MVEARGFEPLSEKAVIGASTSVSCALSFALSAPAGGIELQLSCKVSPRAYRNRPLGSRS